MPRWPGDRDRRPRPAARRGHGVGPARAPSGWAPRTAIRRRRRSATRRSTASGWTRIPSPSGVPPLRQGDGLRDRRRAPARRRRLPGRRPGAARARLDRLPPPSRGPVDLTTTAPGGTYVPGADVAAAGGARLGHLHAAAAIPSPRSPTRTPRPTRPGPARRCRPRRSGSARRAAASRAGASRGATRRRRTGRGWRTSGRASSRGRTPPPTATSAPRPSAASRPTATASPT